MKHYPGLKLSLVLGMSSALLPLFGCTEGSGDITLTAPRCAINPTTPKGQPLAQSDADFGAYLDTLDDPMSAGEIGNQLFHEVGHDAHPLRKIQFVVRVANSAGEPLKNTAVIYSYSRKNADGSAPTHVAFSESLTTDSEGFLIFTQDQPKQVVVSGTASSSSETSSQGGGTLIGPFGSYGGSSTTASQSGFSIWTSENAQPIVLNGEYEGRIQVAGAKVGLPGVISVDGKVAQSKSDLVQLRKTNRFVRMGYYTSYDTGSIGDLFGTENIKDLRLVFRSGIDASFSCSHFLSKLDSVLPNGSRIAYQDAEGKAAADCKVQDQLLTEMTCDSDWVQTVWEQHTVDAVASN